MTEPWMTIWTWSCLTILAGAGVILLYGAIRFRNLATLMLLLAMVIWPVGGEFLNAWARHYVQTAPVAGDTSLLGIWGESPGTFIAKVWWVVFLVQCLLTIGAATATVRFVRRHSFLQASSRTAANSDQPEPANGDRRS